MTTAALQKQQKQISTVRALLDRNKGAIYQALPAHMSADRFLRIALTSFQKTPALLDCTPESFLGAVIQSAQLGLEPDGVTGMAHLIPYSGKVNFQPGFQGLMELARRSGEISQIIPRCVYLNDKFEYSYGLERDDLKHVPSELENPGQLTYVYCIVRLKDGSSYFEVWPVAKVEAHAQRYSQAYKKKKQDSPWMTHFDQMAMKTLIIAALKYAPKSVELQKAIALEEMVQSRIPQNLEIGPGIVEFPTEAPKSQLGEIAEQAEKDQAAAKAEMEADKRAEAARAEARKGLVSDEQIKELQKLALDVGIQSERFSQVLGGLEIDAGTFEEIPAKDFGTVKKYLEGLKA
jgi:recombination protein RecT